VGKAADMTERSLDKALLAPLETPVSLRVLPGLYWHRLTEAAGLRFFEDSWQVASESDRVGYRFKGGAALDFVPRSPPFGAGSDPSNIVDACYPYGSIQVPGGTEPIVLHRDAVSGGGYCMVGTVISADMDRIGQLQPHARVKFVNVDMEQALAARHARCSLLQQARERLLGQWQSSSKDDPTMSKQERP
jgi:urea carboxylase